MLRASSILVYIFLITSCALPKNPAKAQDLVIISQKIDQTNTDASSLISQGISIIELSSSLKDGISFLKAVAHKGDRETVDKTIDLLMAEFAKDDYSKFLVHMTQAEIYRDQFNDRNSELKALEAAQQLRENVDFLQSLDKLRLWNELGQNYLINTNPTLDKSNKDKAFDYFTRIIRFETKESPSSLQSSDIRALQVEASLRLVAMSDANQLLKLNLPLFAYQKVAELYPSKAKALSVPLEIMRGRLNISTWLELKIKDEPENSVMRVHLQAVLDSISDVNK